MLCVFRVRERPWMPLIRALQRRKRESQDEASPPGSGSGNRGPTWVSKRALRLARRKKRKLHKQRLGMTFCSDSTFSTYCDTRAFFLTPVRSKTKNKVDFRSVCKIL